MRQPVVPFEVTGKDAEPLQSFYSDHFDWKINADNPMSYGTVDRDGNVNADVSRSAAASGPGRRAIPGM